MLPIYRASQKGVAKNHRERWRCYWLLELCVRVHTKLTACMVMVNRFSFDFPFHYGYLYFKSLLVFSKILSYLVTT